MPRAQCNPESRVGVVEIEDMGSGTVYAYAHLRDRPAPWLGAPTLSSTTCAFHVAAGSCECTVPQVCAHPAGCADAPVSAAQLRLVLEADGMEQVFSAVEGVDDVGGLVTLPGNTFSVQLRSATRTINLGATVIPAALQGITGSLAGGLDTPTALDVTWTPGPADTAVFTRIPINHHAAADTFTECSVDAPVGSLHVDQAMLQPLAVHTGLEFQGLFHGRFAAAELPEGCVEIRFFTRQFVSL